MNQSWLVSGPSSVTSQRNATSENHMLRVAAWHEKGVSMGALSSCGSQPLVGRLHGLNMVNGGLPKSRWMKRSHDLTITKAASSNDSTPLASESEQSPNDRIQGSSMLGIELVAWDSSASWSSKANANESYLVMWIWICIWLRVLLASQTCCLLSKVKAPTKWRFSCTWCSQSHGLHIISNWKHP